MARMPRSLLPDGIYHVTTRGVDGCWIVHTDDDCRFWLALLGLVRRRFGWTVHAFCLMGNHFHLVVECTQPQLSAGMQILNGRYARWFNDKYARTGHLFGDRFATRLIEDEDYFAEVVEYVVQNPVRAGLCADARDWPWSGSRYNRPRLDADEPGQSLVQLLVRDHEWRRCLDQRAVLPGRNDENAAAPRLLPVTPASAQQTRAPPTVTLESVACRDDPRQEPWNLFQDDERRRARERVAHVRVRVDVFGPEIPQHLELPPNEQRRGERQAAAERLPRAEHVGKLRRAPEDTGPPEPAENLVADQERTGVVAALAEPLEVARRRHTATRPALHRLDDHATSVARPRPGILPVRMPVHGPGKPRREGLTEPLEARRGERQQPGPVVGAVEGHDSGLSRRQKHRPKRDLDCVLTGHAQLRRPRQRTPQGDGHLRVAEIPERVHDGLPRPRLHDPWVPVAQGGDAEAAGEVDVLAALRVDDPAPFGARPDHVSGRYGRG
jgi:REP element-mobilizing transposase RayT